MNPPGFLSSARFFFGTGSAPRPYCRAFPPRSPAAVRPAGGFVRPHQIEHPRQVVSSEGQQRLTGKFLQALVARFAQPAHGLDPAKRLLDHLAPLDAHGVTLASRGATIHRAAHGLARHVGTDAQPLDAANEFLGVIAFVRTHRRTPFHAAPDHLLGRFPFRPAVGLGGLDIDNQAVTVLGQRMGHVTQLRLGEFSLLEQPGFRVRRALMGLVAARFALEVDFRVTSGWAIRTTPVLAHEALVAGPGLDQGAIDTEVLVGNQATPLRQMKHALKNSRAISVDSRRSRLMLNTVRSHTVSSMPRPTNQRNSRL